MKVCFYARAKQTLLFARMGEDLKEKSIESIFVCQDDYEEQRVRSVLPEAKIYNLNEFLKVWWSSYDDTKLSRISEDYHDENIWGMFYTDRFLIRYSHEDALRFIVGHIEFYEKIFAEEKPDIFYNEAVAHYSAYTAYMVGQRYSVRYVGYIVSKDKPFETYFLHNNPYQTNNRLIAYYESGQFSDSEKAKAREYIDSVRNDRKDQKHRQIFDRGSKFKLKYLRHANYFVKYLVDPRSYDRINYMSYRVNINRGFELSRTYLRGIMQKKYFGEGDYGAKYYFFPLHYQPEATTLVCANKYEKQLFAIDQLAKSIPLDHVLYIKEHYVYLGHKKNAFYKEILKYPNVKLISPHASTHDLISNCKAVITLTGTVGFEALILGKPVYVLGNVFYDFLPGVVKIQDVFSEWKKFAEPKATPYDSILRFVCAYQKSMENGCAHSKSPSYDSRENAEAMVEALLRSERSYLSSEWGESM